MGRFVPVPADLPGYVAGGNLPLDRHGRWKHYVEVCVYRDVRSMRKALAVLRPHIKWNDTQACASFWNLKGLPRHRGIVVFHKERIGSGIVAHEMTHAADFYVRGYRKMDPRSLDGQEALASSVGVLVNEFWSWYWKNEKKIRGRKSR